MCNTSVLVIYYSNLLHICSEGHALFFAKIERKPRQDLYGSYTIGIPFPTMTFSGHPVLKSALFLSIQFQTS